MKRYNDMAEIFPLKIKISADYIIDVDQAIGGGHFATVFKADSVKTDD